MIFLGTQVSSKTEAITSVEDTLPGCEGRKECLTASPESLNESPNQQ